MKENIIKCIAVIFCVFAIISCSEKNNGEPQITQKITGAGDCNYCDKHWSWNGGIATVGDIEDEYYISNSIYYPQFNFTANVSGDLSFSYKINDDYLGLISVTGAVSFNDNEEGPSEWTLVKAGHVDAGRKIVVKGRECSIRNIEIIGNIEENEPASNDDDHPQWDF